MRRETCAHARPFTKRLVVSGVDMSIDNNNPLRFGRLFLLNDRTLEATLVLKAGGLWDGQWVLPDDRLEVDVARNRATWSRPWVRPDGKPAVLSYTVTGRPDGMATVDYDMGLSQEEALAQTNALAVCSSFTVGQAVGAQSAFGFGDARSQGEKHPDLNDSRYDFCGDQVKRMLAVNWQLAQGTRSATDREIAEKLERSFTRTEKGYVYEVAFAARYMAPIDLKPGTVAGLGVAVHDWNPDPKAKGGRSHATVSNATRPGQDLNMKPYLLPLMVLVGE